MKSIAESHASKAGSRPAAGIRLGGTAGRRGWRPGLLPRAPAPSVEQHHPPARAGGAAGEGCVKGFAPAAIPLAVRRRAHVRQHPVPGGRASLTFARRPGPSLRHGRARRRRRYRAEAATAAATLSSGPEGAAFRASAGRARAAA